MSADYGRLIAQLRKLSKPEFWITLQKRLSEEHNHQSRVIYVRGLPNDPVLGFVWNRATGHKMAAPYMAADEAKREVRKAKNAARKCRKRIDGAIAIYTLADTLLEKVDPTLVRKLPQWSEISTKPPPQAGRIIRLLYCEVLARNKRHESKPVECFLHNRSCKVDNQVPIVLEESEVFVLKSLIQLGGAGNKSDLADQTGKEDSPRVLKNILTKHPMLKPYIKLPGGRGKGGYRTRIRMKSDVVGTNH
jgi:hypothetical protein